MFSKVTDKVVELNDVVDVAKEVDLKHIDYSVL